MTDHPTIRATIADGMRRAKDAGLSQRELSRITGISQAKLSRLAAGKADINTATLDRLMPALNLALISRT